MVGSFFFISLSSINVFNRVYTLYPFGLLSETVDNLLDKAIIEIPNLQNALKLGRQLHMILDEN